ncbi:sulfate adenylyltransferase [Ruaniaceae bacterium KH17]|nr:sulfate adenylyltransferase [Ruaniaceae bacterium KH17]
MMVALGGGRLEALELVLSGLLPGVRGYALPGTTPSGPMLDVPAGVTVGDELELCDHENTPLAVLTVDGVQEGLGGRVWVAGGVRGLREAQHGPARAFRFTGADDFSKAVVAVFSGAVRVSDAMHAVRVAEGRQLVLVAEGSSHWADSARLVGELVAVAQQVPGSVVRFVPQADLGPINAVDAVLSSCGARQVLDFRQSSAVNGEGAVILFTGLSGSGKSTIARALAERLAGAGRRAVLLDGDHVRAELASELGFSPEDRHTNLVRQAWVGARVAEAGGIAICAPIAPFAASRAAMRAKVEPQSQFILVYVSTPLEVAEARDRKGLYAKARAGEITDFTGIDSPYEVPEDADLVIDTSTLSVAECVESVAAIMAG